MRSASGYGNGLSNTAFTTLNIAVFTPMPTASVSTANSAKPGFFRSHLMPYFRSVIIRVNPWPPSYLNASNGSTRLARQAGTKHANNAANNNSNATPPNAYASNALTPYKVERIALPTAYAPTSPIITPLAASITPSFNTTFKTRDSY